MQEITRMFREAIKRGNIATVHNFLKKYQHDDIANWRLDDDGYSALHYLSYLEVSIDELHRRRLARLLLEYGANVNLKAKFDMTPIFDACALPSELLVELFIKHGADVDLLDASDRTVLFSAVENNEVDILVDLIDAGAGTVIDVVDENGDAVIHLALTSSLADIRVLRELIHADANLDLQNENGHTLLHLNVLSHRNEAAARLLLEKGADYSIEDINGVTALQEAAKTGFYPLINWLIEAGVSAQDNNGVLLLEDCVEKFKIILLENPTLLKPVELVWGLDEKRTYLSNKWHAIQQELIKMQNTKIGLTEYSFYDILSEKNPIKVKKIFSEQVVIDAINDNTLEAFPDFSSKIKSLKNDMKRIEGVGTSYSIYDIYTEKDKNELAKIFLNRNLENKVKELVNKVDLDSVVRGKLWRNLKIGVERRDLLRVSLDYTNDSSGVKRLSLEMIQEILKLISSEQLRDITFTNLSAEENREIDSDLARNVAQLFVILSSNTASNRNLPLIFRIKNANDIFVFLKMLNYEKFMAVFDYVNKNLPLSIHNANDFYISLKNLNAEQRVMLLDCFKGKLPSIIKNTNDFYRIYKELNVAQRTILFDQIKEILPSFIHAADDFYRIYKNLNTEQRAVLFDRAKEALPSIIKNADDFYFVFMNLNIEQRVNIFAQVKQIFPSIINNAEDFYSVFKYLNSEQRVVIFEDVKGKLSSIIFRANDFYLILENLNAKQRATTFNLLRQKVPSLIRCSDDFHMILENLNVEQRTVIFNSVKEGLFLFAAYDFYIVTKNLNMEQRAIIFNVMKDGLYSMIFNADDIYYAFKHLNSEQHAILFKNVKEKLLYVINNVGDLTTVFVAFNTERRLEVLKILEEKLPLIIDNADAYRAFIKDLNSSERTYLDQLLKSHKYNLLAVDSNLIAFEDCLPGPSGHRLGKRNTPEAACQFSWEDVDKFNAEKEKPREVNEIKINSDQYIATLEDPSLSETKQAQLFKFPERFPVVGSSQERVNDLIKHQKNLRYLHKVGRLSGMATQGMMVKNTLRDFFQGDYEGVAINIGFIAGGQGFAKMATAVSVQGKRFVAKGQRLLGQSLKIASPFLARGTSVFIAYDLVEQIKAYKKGNPDAAIGMLGDGIYLGVDGVEIGIEIAEGLELLEGVSSVTGPIGATIGAIVFIGTDIYSAVKVVNKIDAQIHLTGKEKLIEGSRAFLGMQSEQHIEKLLRQKQVNNELFAQGLAFLKRHPTVHTVQRIIFPTINVVSKCIAKYIPKSCQLLGQASFGICASHSRTQALDPGQQMGGCTSKLKPDLDNIMMFEEKKNDIKWSRVKPDVTEGNLFCFTGGGEEIPSDGAYFCDKAMGIEYPDRAGNTTVIKLGDGNDIVVGFPQDDHIVMLGNGHKNVRLGNGSDIFLLEGNENRGFLQGGGGTNILDLGSFAKQKKYIAVDLQDTVGYLNVTTQLNSEPEVLRLYDITDFLLRLNKQDFVQSVCNPHSIDGRGGENQDNPDIIVVSENYNCTHALKFTIRPYTRIINRAINSQFSYLIPHENKGENTVDVQSDGSAHRFVFDYTIHDIDSIEKMGNTLHLAFKNEFKLHIAQYGKNTICQLSDNTQIKVEQDELYALQSTDKTIDYIIEHYPRVASQLNLFMIVRVLASNDSITIGHSKHDVLYNDPDRRSHLIGNSGENVFVISSGREVLDKNKSPIIPEIVLYDVDRESLIDTLDLRRIRNQLEKDLGLKIQAKTSLQDQDILIGLFSSTDLSKSLVTVRLKDALRTDWYKKLHIILNHVLMEFFTVFELKQVPLKFEADKDKIIISPEDVEENTKLVLAKKSGNYRFFRELNNLLISNAFTNNLAEADRYTLSLQEFYQTPKLETLSIQFSDKEIVLKDEMAKIEHATDFTAECEQYHRTMYDTFFNKNARQENSRPARHLQAEGIEKPELNKSSWGIMTSTLLPIVGAMGAVFGAGMGYRYQARNRLRAAALPAVAKQAVMTVPLLTPTIEAKSSKQQEKIRSNSKESYSEQNSRFTQGSDANMAGNVSLLRCLFHFLGWDSVVARINQAESVLASANDSMTPLDLIEQSVKKAIGSSDFRCAPKSNGTNWATKKNTASFFQANVASTMDHKPEYKLIGLASGT